MGYVPLGEYGDIPATRTWSELIKQEIILIKHRLDAIENQVKGLTGREGETTVDSGGMSLTTHDLLEATYQLSMVRRALYGYAVLLGEMGLSKDQKQLVRDFENVTSAVLRLMQAIRIAWVALAALEAAESGDPLIAIARLAIAGGYFASSLYYTSKISGGGF